MPGFGGSPGLSILTGVAKGITDRQARQAEAQNQAIINRLRQVQTEGAQQDILLAAEQEQRASQKAARDAEVARVEMEDRAASMEQVMEEIRASNPNATRAEVQRQARARMNPDYLKQLDDDREAEKDAADTERIRATTATERERPAQIRASTQASQAQAGASRASANASEALAEQRRQQTKQGAATPARETSARVQAEARAEAEVRVQEAERELRKISPRAAPGKEAKYEAAIRERAADMAVETLRNDIARETASGSLSPEALLLMQYLVKEAEDIRTETRRGARRAKPEVADPFADALSEEE